MAELRLYELSNLAGVNHSPFVWRVKFALQRKGLSYDRIPLSFLEIPKVDDGAFKTVPILEYQGERRNESWAIAEWLDATFPERPIFSSSAELAMVRFFDKWFGTQVMTPMFRSCVRDIWEQVKPTEQAYFRSSRERILGESLEDIAASAPLYLNRMRDALLPARLALRQGDFLGGTLPNYADFIAWGAFIAFDPIVKQPLLTDDDPLQAWLERGRALARDA